MSFLSQGEMKVNTRTTGNGIPSTYILGTRVHTPDWDEGVCTVLDWARHAEHRQVCFANVHMLVTAQRNDGLSAALADTDLVCPDGMPVAWVIRNRVRPEQQRVNGPDFMWRLCGEAATAGIGIYLYGSTKSTLNALRVRLREAFPSLRVCGTYAPPFRSLSRDEETEVVRDIRESGAGIVFIGLGCPKQEIWAHTMKSQLPAVLLAVGAAFDYHAGTLRRAPPWMRKSGLEWLFRILTEPRRLWRRYLVTNTLFAIGLMREGWRSRSRSQPG